MTLRNRNLARMLRDLIPKRLKVAHLLSLRELIKPWRCCYGSFAHSEMITERCRANNESRDGPLILFMKEVQYPPKENADPSTTGPRTALPRSCVCSQVGKEGLPPLFVATDELP